MIAYSQRHKDLFFAASIYDVIKITQPIYESGIFGTQRIAGEKIIGYKIVKRNYISRNNRDALGNYLGDNFTTEEITIKSFSEIPLVAQNKVYKIERASQGAFLVVDQFVFVNQVKKNINLNPDSIENKSLSNKLYIEDLLSTPNESLKPPIYSNLSDFELTYKTWLQYRNDLTSYYNNVILLSSSYSSMFSGIELVKFLDKFVYQGLNDSQKQIIKTRYESEMAAKSGGGIYSFSDLGKALTSVNLNALISQWSFENPKEAAVGAALLVTGVGALESAAAAIGGASIPSASAITLPTLNQVGAAAGAAIIDQGKQIIENEIKQVTTQIQPISEADVAKEQYVSEAKEKNLTVPLIAGLSGLALLLFI